LQLQECAAWVTWTPQGQSEDYSNGRYNVSGPKRTRVLDACMDRI
jgi:hypothetical protein